MKVAILAGGFGTRLAEYTDLIPKPMVEVGEHPILWHIMHFYASYGHKDFYVALGYKAQVIKQYFLNYYSLDANLTVDLSSGEVKHHSKTPVDWKISMIDTGQNSMTGGRVRRLKDFIGNEPVLLTYGDGLSDVNLDDLLKFHKSHGKMVTVTAVHPAARFGELDLSEAGQVKRFKEKPQTEQGWINGGYFVIEPGFFEFIEGDETVLEAEPLERAAREGQLMAYCHPGFWQCMDTVRDRDVLNALWKTGQAPWRRW